MAHLERTGNEYSLYMLLHEGNCLLGQETTLLTSQRKKNRVLRVSVTIMCIVYGYSYTILYSHKDQASFVTILCGLALAPYYSACGGSSSHCTRSIHDHVEN